MGSGPSLLRVLTVKSSGTVTILNETNTTALLNELDQTFGIRTVGTKLKVIDPGDNIEIGTIFVGKSRISLREFNFPLVEDIYVESANGAVGEEDNGTPLKRYIDRNDLFTVLFDDFALAYIDGSLYRDDLLADGGGNFLRHIRADDQLNNVTSEKGTFSITHRSFDTNSVFGTVINSIADGDEVLICDDLGTEWADFIGINGQARPKTISFYHAKHGDLSLGASPFHVAVSQALKNLGRMTLAAEAIEAKLPIWSNTYSNDNVQTSILRFLRGDAATLQLMAEDTRQSPDTIRRVFIVTSSLSLRELEQTLTDISAGVAPKPHFVQLYWLLTSYFSACAEVGAYAYVVCQE
jgi:hypothetical protein